MYGETLDFQCQHLQRYHGIIFNGNLLQKFIFLSGTPSNVPITDTGIASLKSLKTLFNKNLYLMQVKVKQNCICFFFFNIQHFEFLGENMVNHFY